MQQGERFRLVEPCRRDDPLFVFEQLHQHIFRADELRVGLLCRCGRKNVARHSNVESWPQKSGASSLLGMSKLDFGKSIYVALATFCAHVFAKVRRRR